jgi:mannosyltransferase OCH1-like enzyme
MEQSSKIVWLWWEQGWDNAPKICLHTCKSFEKMNPTWRIQLVSKNNLFNFIDEEYSWIYQCSGAAFRADIVRLLLLQKYGGAYSDAAALCLCSLDDLINDINFDKFWGFDIKSFNKKPDVRTLCSWFYLSTKNNYIINKFTDTFIDSAKRQKTSHIYFLHHEVLTKLIESDPIFTNWYNKLEKRSGFQNRIPANWLHLNPKNIKVNDSEKWNLPYDLEDKIKNNFFTVIKLRHRGVNYNNLYIEGSLFNILYSKILK